MDNQSTNTKSIADQIIDETLRGIEKSPCYDKNIMDAMRLLVAKSELTDKKSLIKVLQNKNDETP